MFVIALFAISAAQFPVLLNCPEKCDSMLQKQTTPLVFTYSNPNAAQAPFPVIKQFTLTVYDSKNESISLSKDIPWPSGNITVTVDFKPEDWIQNAQQLVLKVRYTLVNFDTTPGGMGENIMGAIIIKDAASNIASSVTGLGTVVIGNVRKSSAVAFPFRPLYLPLLLLFVI